MPNINGRPEIPAGYFHDSGDALKTTTPRRASFAPSLSDSITNKFARSEQSASASFVHGFRKLDLSLRKAVNDHRHGSARGRFEALEQAGNASAEQLQTAGAHMDRLAHKARRLETKQMLGQVALAGELEAGLQEATEGLQEDMRKAGYVPLAGLRDTPHDSIPSRYLVAPGDGHRIKINSERAPLLARLIADSVSDGYDRGSSGASRAVRSTVQHALVGIYSAEQSLKGMVADHLAASEHLDQGARARMEVRSARTGQNRMMMHAALRGTPSLNQAYGAAVDQQVEEAKERLDRDGAPRYELRAGVGGVKPPQIRFWERRVDTYYQDPAPTAAPQQRPHKNPQEKPEAAPLARRAGAIARFAMGVANVRGKASHAYHNAAKQSADARVLRSDDPAERTKFTNLAARHQAGADKSQYSIAARRSILQGKLIDTLKDDTLRAPMNNSFPRARDGEWHGPNRPEAQDDDDLYN